jgi:DNA-binding HxlR family transcriptional regulator
VKSYKQFCSMARALDVVGDRWALLVVRELLLGPRRYTDLAAGLPGIGTNVLATRLRDLEAAGIIERRQLPVPTPVTVYELTDDGRDLRSVVDALGRWGARLLTSPAEDDTIAPRWLVTSISAAVDAGRLDDGAVFGLIIDDERFELAIRDGVMSARHGEAGDPIATLTGALHDFFATAKGKRSHRRRIDVGGDRTAGERLVEALTGCLA